MLARDSPLRSALTGLAVPAATAPATPPPNPAGPADEPAHRRAARYAWDLLLVRIYEVFLLLCPKCGSEMRIIAFMTEAAAVRDILPTSVSRRCRPGSRPPGAHHCGRLPFRR